MIMLPKWSKKRIDRSRIKICKEPGCELEFIGHWTAKYCPAHKDPRSRKRDRGIKAPYKHFNQEFKHTYTNTPELEFTCALAGCNNKFKMRLYHGQYVYPKYCEEHRSEYRRSFFSQKKGMVCEQCQY